MYEYRARVISVYDGDTLKLQIDLGLKVFTIAHVRLAAINTPELKDEGGADAKLRLQQLVLIGSKDEYPLIINTIRDRTEKYGRWLALIRLPDGRDVGEILVAEGHARSYAGGRR